MNRQIALISVVLVAAIIVAGVFLATRLPDSAESDTFSVGYQPTMLYLPVFVAQEKGYFIEQSLDVELIRFGSANEMAQALATGRIDATGMSSLTVLANLEKSFPGVFSLYLFEVLGANYTPDAIVVNHDSDIASVDDLRGKSLGLHPGTTLRTYAEAYLEQHMGPDHGVRFIGLPPHLQVQSLQTGSIDALFTLEPIVTLAMADGQSKVIVRGLISKAIHDPFYAGAGAISNDSIEQNPEAAKAYRRAIKKALKFISTNEISARLEMPKYAPVSEETATRMSLVGWVEPSRVLHDDWLQAVDRLIALGLMPEGVDLERTFLND